MQQEFAPLVTLVVIVGVITVGIGGTLLFMTFRAFATAKPGDVQHIVLLISTIVFILFACMALLVSSMIFRR